MITFKSRNKVLSVIIGIWILLFLVIFAVSEILFSSGFKDLEKTFSKESNNRVFNIIKGNLQYIYRMNVDYAFWDDTYQFVLNKNKTFKKELLVPALFTDNRLNYVILTNRRGQLIWGKQYSYKEKKLIEAPRELVRYVQDHGDMLINNRATLNNFLPEATGVAGFYQLKNNAVSYITLNAVHDSDAKKKPVGFLLLGRILNTEYFKSLSKQIDYPINLLKLDALKKDDEGLSLLKSINQTRDGLYVNAVDNKFMASYRYIYDIEKNPIALLQVDLSRKMYLESEKNALGNQVILFIFSMLAIGSMCFVVFVFFRYQERLMSAFEKFVPKEFVSLLNKEEIVNIALGDNIEKTITVLFLDIRNFTTLSESMSPNENFNFINQFLSHTAPIIHKNNGFIDKFIGDAVMALFTDPISHVDDAIKAALEMNQSLESFNAMRKENGESDDIAIGVGINTGPMMLGIIGTRDRIEGTVISDTVNSASRIESATKTYNQPVLVSEESVKRINRKQLYKTHFEGNLLAKGKSKEIAVYSVTMT